MSAISNKINGVDRTIPKEFDGSKIDLQYLPNGVLQQQPSLTISGLTFTNDSKDAIKDFIDSNGVFKMLDYQVDINNVNVQNGYLYNFKINDDRDYIECDFDTYDGLNLLSDRLASLTSLLLSDLYKKQTHYYIIEGTKEQKIKEAVTISIALVNSIYILTQVTKDISDFIAEQTEVSAGSVLEKVLKAIALAIYVGVILASVVVGYIDLFNLAVQQLRRTKVISLKELIKVPLEYLGYNLVTNLDDMDNVYHWASRYTDNQDVTLVDEIVDTITDGLISKSADLFVPNSSDLLQSPLEVLNFIQKKYAAYVSVDQYNNVYIYHKEDDFWKKEANVVLDEGFPLEEYKYNLDEHTVNTTIEYATDTSDQWTFEDFKGNHFLVSSQIDDFKNSTAKGSEFNSYGLARTTRKDELNFLEKIYESLAKAINSLARLVGGSFVPEFQSRIGAAIISNELFSVAKLVYLNSKGRIPSNHKDKLSAKSDFEQWQWANSWVLNPNNKKLIYENVKVRFNFDKFINVLNNRYIKLFDGRLAELRSLEWITQRDYAIIEMAIIEDFKTDLIETYYESER